jgi:DNA processing protein
MFSLPARWHAAACLSGQIDLSQAVQASPGQIAQLSAAQLEQLEVRPDHAHALDGERPLSSPWPFLTLDDPDYPEILRPIPFAPPVLFWAGNPELLRAQPKVAIVGSRRCTGDGRRMARALACALAEHHAAVISGMAFGIDTAAHLAAPQRTVAVLGQGLSARRTGTAERTAQTILSSGGLLLSEFLPAWPASKHTFPLRNRVIAGLSDLTVVVEAAQRSGASITARLALEAGREVAAVPGSPFAPTSAGCLRLLHQGAALIRGPEDLLELLQLELAQVLDPSTKTHPILLQLGDEGACFDLLVDTLGMTPASLGAALGALELQGQIRRLPGDRFVLATSSSGGSSSA